MRDDLVGNLKRPLEVFSAAVVLVLLIACANVANLTLTRGAARQREIAVRTALGAGRGRIVRQLVTESLILSVLGGVLGAMITVYGVRLLRLGFPDDVPYYIPIGVNVPTLVFAAIVSVISGLAFGIIPAFRATDGSLDRALREGGRGGSDGPARGRLRNAIVVGELALSVTLMIGAGLLVKSYRALASTTLGIRGEGDPVVPHHAAVRKIRESGTPAGVLRDAPAASPGAAVGRSRSASRRAFHSVAGTFRPPSSRRAGRKPKPGEDFVSHYQFVSPTFFRTIGVPLQRGRGLAEADRDTVNRSASSTPRSRDARSRTRTRSESRCR